MGKPVENILSLIGDTPIVKLKNISKGSPAEIWAKLEFFNPTGSVKDRIALRMIEEAERRGQLTKGSVIVEPTSGNTGIGLSLVCAMKGYKMIAVMPEAMSNERRMIMELLGAKVEIVPSVGDKNKGFTKEDIENTLARAQEIVRNTPNAFLPNQFENPDNPIAHADTTAKEIIEQTKGEFHAFVAACGTGGTFTGVAKVLKERFPQIKTVVVEPETSAVLSGGMPGFHKIQGIGEGFVPAVMDMKYADQVMKVKDEDSIATVRRLAREEGILSGISGGCNVSASLEVAKTMNPGSIVLTVIPDHVFRYCSTNLLNTDSSDSPNC